jgi:hypothetical protein
MKKHCNKCNLSKDINLFYNRRNAPDGHAPYCKKCQEKINTKYRTPKRKKIAKLRSRVWRINNSDHKRLVGVQWRLALKVEVLTYYCGGSPRCMCPHCNTTILSFLGMDHIHGDGNKHRAKITKGGSGSSIYNWLKSHGFPSGFQVLCHNCNHAKGTGPVCPHC